MDLKTRARDMARKYGIPEGIFLGLIDAESSWRTGVTSSAGAIGLTQVMPGTAREMGYDPDRLRADPMMQLEAGARYLSERYKEFGTWELALAAYNAGPGAVNKYGGIPPFEETQKYVRKVMGSAISAGTELPSRGERRSPKIPTGGEVPYYGNLAANTGRADVFAGARRDTPYTPYTDTTMGVNPILDRLNLEPREKEAYLQEQGGRDTDKGKVKGLTQLPGRLPSEILDGILNLKRRDY